MTRSAPPPGPCSTAWSDRPNSGPTSRRGSWATCSRCRRSRPTTKRLIDAHAEIIDSPADDIAFCTAVLCQTSLPYRPTDERVWIRDQGDVSLLIEAGHARHPDTGKWVELRLPHGEKPRLVMLHLNSEAVRTGSPIIDVDGSLTAFVRSLGIDTNGRNIRTLRTSSRVSPHPPSGSASSRTAAHADQHADRQRFDLWMPKDADQRVLWPSTVTLSADYFDLLQRACRSARQPRRRGAGHSALDLDVYAWLAQRLHRIVPRASRRRSHGRRSSRSSARTMTGCATSAASSCWRSRPS